VHAGATIAFVVVVLFGIIGSVLFANADHESKQDRISSLFSWISRRGVTVVA